MAKVGDGTPGPGRPKGMPNKATASIKKAFAEAFEQRGGTAALMKWAETNETEFYRLASKLIPTEITGKDGGAIQTASEHSINLSKLTTDQLASLASIKVDD